MSDTPAASVPLEKPVTRILTVTLNPAFDRAVTLDGLEEERVNRILTERLDPGGKGVNVARVLTRFGVPATAVVLAGQENVDTFRRLLRKEKVTAVYLPMEGSIRENSTFTLPDGRIFKIDKSGSPVGSQVLLQVEHAIGEQITDPTGSVVVFAGSLPPRMDTESFTALLRRLSETGIRVALDTQSLTAAQTLSARPWLIKPNIHELRAMTGKELKDRKEILDAAVSLIRSGIDNVMVSMGEEGILFVDRQQAIQVTPPTVEALSTVGAGDSTLAGFLFARTRNLSNDKAAPVATAFGTASVLVEGTNPPKKEDVNRILKELKASRLALNL